MKTKQQIFESPMARAWRKAAKDLDIKFISPYPLKHGDKIYWCSGFLPDFGWPNGTIILGKLEEDKAMEIADELEYFTSGLNPSDYERYDRDLFIGTLCDWGWEGLKEEVPSWYDPNWRKNIKNGKAEQKGGESASRPTD